MGQKTRPTGFRIGIVEDWRSRWYAPKKEFGQLLVEDKRIRDFIRDEYKSAAIAEVVIERTRDQVVVNLHSARPGIIIGRKGQEIDRLKARLEDLTGRRMEVKIHEISNPYRKAKLVAEAIAQQRSGDGSRRAWGQGPAHRSPGWCGDVASREGCQGVHPAFNAAAAR